MVDGSDESYLDKEWPSVTLIITAYNEEDIISKKIKNSLKLQYPQEKLDIVIVSDGSTDQTDNIIESYMERGVIFQRIEGRVGKAECQNRIVAETNSDIIVFSDANSIYDEDALIKLIREFEPGVGCVVGKLTYATENGSDGESVYWHYEHYIKQFESAFNSLVTGNGSIYAVRTDTFVPHSADLVSDFAEPLALVGSGKTVKYAPKAVATERTRPTGEEYTRRVRIVTRSWHTVSAFRGLLNPISHPRFSFQLSSHKLLRWLSPGFLLGALVSNVLLTCSSENPLYRILLCAQGLLYGLASYGALADRTDLPSPLPTHIAYYFLVSNSAMAVGLVNFLQGRNIVAWETVNRDEKIESE